MIGPFTWTTVTSTNNTCSVGNILTYIISDFPKHWPCRGITDPYSSCYAVLIAEIYSVPARVLWINLLSASHVSSDLPLPSASWLPGHPTAVTSPDSHPRLGTTKHCRIFISHQKFNSWIMQGQGSKTAACSTAWLGFQNCVAAEVIISTLQPWADKVT